MENTSENEVQKSEAYGSLICGQPLEVQGVQTREELASSYKVLGSQSSTENEKCGDGKRRGTCPRSKSFLEESSRVKTVTYMQQKPEVKGVRSTHGSHGDGFSPEVPWESKRLTLSESVDRGGDQQRKLQIATSGNYLQAAGVTQKLFDSNVTFADLVRVCSTTDNKAQVNKVQLSNTLLSTTHASTLVSNYLNTYRSYLEQLRKTCGRGDSHIELIGTRAPSKSVPLVLPLARMTPVFSDDSREDPEFLELLKKTTTESIRKLWPHPHKTNIVRKAGLVDTAENQNEQVVPETVTLCDVLDTDNFETDSSDSSVQKDSEQSNCKESDFSSDEVKNVYDESLTICDISSLNDNRALFSEVEDQGEIPTRSNPMMKSPAETVIVGDGGSSNVPKSSSGGLRKGLLKLPNESMTSGDNFYKHISEASSPTTTVTSDWSDNSQQKYTNESKPQPAKPSALDSFLQHQQKLLQQQQLQRQILQHQQQQQQLQQQRQQQQLLQQYQQQQQQELQRHQTVQAAVGKPYGLQSCQDPSKQWFQTVGGSNALSSSRACLTTSTQPTTTYSSGRQTTQEIGLDSWGSAGSQASSGYFHQNKLQGISVFGSSMDNPPLSGFSETADHTRTLKASYACLDPTNPMTLSVDPFHEYGNENDVFLNSTDMPQFDKQSFPSFTSNFGERVNGSETSRSWAEASRSISNIPDNEATSATDGSIEERIRRAYAKSRISQVNQQSQWCDTQRQPIQNQFIKTNSMFDAGQSSQPYNLSNQGGCLDTVPGSISENSMGDSRSRDRWSWLSNCYGQPDASGTDVMTSNIEGMGEQIETNFMPSQELIATDQPSRVSRMYQWKQDVVNTGETNFIQPVPKTSSDSIGFQSNDNTAVGNSLLSGLQIDRDFSWNASSISSSQNGLCPEVDDQGLGRRAEQSKFTDSYLKLSSLTCEQRRQLSNNNNASLIYRSQVEQVKDSNLFFDTGESKAQTWSLKGRQASTEDVNKTRLNSTGCGPMLSRSMQFLNNKILASQSNNQNLADGRTHGDGAVNADGRYAKDREQNQSDASSPSSVESQSADNIAKQRLNRAFSDPNNANSVFKKTPHSSVSMSQLSVLQQQQQQQQMREKVDQTMFKLSEELDKTYVSDIPNKTPWHELAPEESCVEFNMNSSKGKNDKFVKINNFENMPMALGDGDLTSLRPKDNSCIYDSQQQTKEHLLQGAVGNQLSNMQMARSQQGTSRPRMILGANSLQQTNEDKMKDDVEESNRRLREMLGLAPTKDPGNSGLQSGMRMQDGLYMTQQSISPRFTMATQMQGQVQQNNAQTSNSSQIPRMQITGGKMQTPMGMAQQMYCVPNILMPPPPVQSPNSSRQSNMIPLQGVVTSMGSSSRFPQGMIRVPFVDMSRLVYVHQMPVNMSSTPNNNHNNSSSSNPHVNTSNIITINTNDNDFSSNSQGDKCGRPGRSNTSKSKTAFLKMRSGSEEFTLPILGMRPSLDDPVCPRLIKTRTNPWDQDLDHDFSNSLMSKAASMDNMAGLCASPTINDPNICNSDLMYPEMSAIQGGHSTNNDQASNKAATFLQWPASADMHPEMLDMLPVRRAVPAEDCNTGRLCFPEMEFLMSSREQLQAGRRSNKPMGSNKANLISIIPKGISSEGTGVGGKEQRFEKTDNRLA